MRRFCSSLYSLVVVESFAGLDRTEKISKHVKVNNNNYNSPRALLTDFLTERFMRMNNEELYVLESIQCHSMLDCIE